MDNSINKSTSKYWIRDVSYEERHKQYLIMIRHDCIPYKYGINTVCTICLKPMGKRVRITNITA